MEQLFFLTLPAWPANWDTNFKLQLSNQTIVSGKVTNGELVGWSVEPESREKDVTIFQPQL